MLTGVRLLITFLASQKPTVDEVWGRMSQEPKNLEAEIRKIVAEILETEEDEIKLDSHFVRDLGMDSMMALEILATIEKKYKIVIPEDALPKFTDLRTTVSIVKDILAR